MKLEVFEGKTLEDAKEKALKSLEASEKEIMYKTEEKKGGLFKSATYIVKAIKISDIAEFLKDKLNEMLKNMNIEAKFETSIRDEQINIPNNPLRGLRVFTNKCVHNNLKALVFGNSFSENFSRVLATRISKVVRIRTHGDYAPQAADVRVFPYIVNSHTLEFDPDYVFSVNFK